MNQTLAELTQYVRETVPHSKNITHLRSIADADLVAFHWQGREFAVKKSLHVMEMKGKRLYITGASMLMQLVLTNKNRNEKIIRNIVSILAECEEAIGHRRQSDTGLKLIEIAKGSLATLAGKRPTRREAAFQKLAKVLTS